MRRSSEDIRRRIIGLGDSSVQKSYYPVLQDKIRELEGKQKQLVGLVRSLEEHEAELEALITEKDLLLAEVNHRVKNNLQIITSLISLSEAEADISDSEKLFVARKRIETLSLVYQEFLFSDNYTEVMFCGFLRAVSGEIKTDLNLSGNETVFDFPVDEIILSVDRAVPLALIAYEAVSAAFKYAASSGFVKISLFPVNDEGRQSGYRLIFSAGGGAGEDLFLEPDELYSRLLVDALSHQLGCRYRADIGSNGFKFLIEF